MEDLENIAEESNNIVPEEVEREIKRINLLANILTGLVFKGFVVAGIAKIMGHDEFANQFAMYSGIVAGPAVGVKATIYQIKEGYKRYLNKSDSYQEITK